jgi:two-component system, chemotaxis family, protein-glutamate methylesterase/glutaminase
VDTELSHFAIIVIGASAGGVEALKTLASGLPHDIPAAVLMVQHIGEYPSRLPELLAHAGPLPARHANQGELVRPGRIFVAPPDHHLMLLDGALRLTRGPRENWARPAIDPLFRSAADIYGRRVIGVVLTGALNDGTAGLHAVRANGGTAIVQHPGDATCPDMPASALLHAGADYCVPLCEMPRLLYDVAGNIANQALRLRAGGQSDE